MPSTKRPFDLNKFVINHLRREFHKSPEYKRALLQALRPYGKYECAKCTRWFPRDEIEVDHIEPVIPVTGWAGFDVSIPRLWCSYQALQILCDPCHKEKSKIENAERRMHKKAKGST
jgi:5-methylcytosine-specific restriction endonuclease McrA